MTNLIKKIEFLNWNGRYNTILDNNGNIDILLSDKGQKLANKLLKELELLKSFSPNITRTMFKTLTAKNKPKYFYSDSVKNIHQKISYKSNYCNAKFYFEVEYKQILIEVRPDGWGYIISKPCSFNKCLKLDNMHKPQKGYKTFIVDKNTAYNNPKLIKNL
jgi:hypothetical protein